MKKIVLLISILLVTITAHAQKLPDVKVENHKGEVISTRTLSNGKPMIIAFWSTTCKPCIMELDAINEQLEEWREDVDFDVIAVSTDDSRSISRARAMVNGKGWDFISIYDRNQDLKRAMQVSLTPHSFVVDAEGNIVSSHTGYTPGSELVLFEKLLELKK